MKATAIMAFMFLLPASAVAAGPVVLAHDDIADEYEKAPEYLDTNARWLGLYAGSEGSGLKAAKVFSESRREGSQTTFRVVSNPPGAVALFSQVPGLSAGPVVTTARDLDIGSESREVTLKLASRVYTLRLLSSRDDLCDAVIVLGAGDVAQKLFQSRSDEELSCDEPHFRIHWAGDLDRDGRLDVLATFSQKYSFYPRKLFLSSAAGNGTLVFEVAVTSRVAQ
jgi:hypothetical protein